MESIRLPYKNDSYNNPMYARIAWSKSGNGPRPIALIYHGGGLVVGSSEIVPKVQIEYLANQGFIVVIPNYRLAPQVTGKDAFKDCEEAYDWATSPLAEIMRTEYGVEVDVKKVVTMGHSSGGTIAFHIASCRPIQAISAFYPSLYTSDPSTSSHNPTTAFPFGAAPDFIPTKAEWTEITPQGKELSEAPLALPGSIPAARNKWQMHILKHGLWPQNIQPDGNYTAIDPLTRIDASWPPVMIVQGDADSVPGSSLVLAQRAEREMLAAGVKEVRLEVLEGESHMFDLPPSVGKEDLGAKWEAVVKGMDWLRRHV